MKAETSGEVYLDTIKFDAAEKIPFIQKNIGIFSVDNYERLKSIAEMVDKAAEERMWGDVVYLFNAFSMNAHGDYVQVDSPQMRYGLWEAVAGINGKEANPALISLYASTSSSPYLAAAFKALKKGPPEKRWWSSSCSNAHQAAKDACYSLIDSLRSNITFKTGGPRSICYGGCCVSWSANATFQFQNLVSAADYCYNACGGAYVSCEVWGVELQGTIVDQCLSNRPDCCT